MTIPDVLVEPVPSGAVTLKLTDVAVVHGAGEQTPPSGPAGGAGVGVTVGDGVGVDVGFGVVVGVAEGAGVGEFVDVAVADGVGVGVVTVPLDNERSRA